jgi:hypothetical protein
VIFSDSDPCTCQVVLVKYEQEPLVTNLGTGVCL